MQFKLKNHNPAFFVDPWVVSSALHGLVVVMVFVIVYVPHFKKNRALDIELYESPKVAQQPVQLNEPRPAPKKPLSREVFGVSPKSVVSDQGEAVKAGNTVAKMPDQEQLKPGDADSLPIPSEDYLVTNMPELKSDVRIPYPPKAKKMGLQGAVVMDLLIDPSGTVRDVALVEGPGPELNAAALAAAKGFQFTPARIQDKPVAVRIRYLYRFVLER